MRKKYISFLASLSVMFFFASGERSLAVPVMTASNCYVDKGLKDFSVVSTRRFADAYHVFSHGRPGYLLIEGRWLGAKELAVFLARHVSLSITHLNIYGCNFGYGAEGKAAVSYLKDKLGVTVNASDDITGKDGDWELEVGEQGQEALRIAYEGNLQCTDPKKLLGACDFDGDGILNNVDLDDDNDGVLDAEESPSCFYKKLELQGSIKITSQFTSPDDNQTDGDILLLHDGATIQTFNFDAFTTTQNPTGSNLFTIEYPTPVTPATIVISDNISATTNADAVVKGSNDGVTWSTALSPATLITGSPVTFNLTNTTPFKYYRIETGSIAGALATANTIGEITTTFRGYGASSHPKSVCTTDTDNDGIVNHLDLDSDGDGCFDSFEAGVTGSTKSGASTDSIATAPYGSNGLANSLENNDTDTAKVNYDSKYTLYAVSKTWNVCLDTDNDGIGDLVDFDDDNDGIPDVDERVACGVTPAPCPSLARGWEGRVYDNNKNGSAVVLWDAVNSSATPFPSSTFTQAASFDYNGLNTTCKPFDLSIEFRSGEVYADNLRNQVSNYIGAKLDLTDLDNGLSFRHVVEPGSEGKYEFSMDVGDDHILIFVNGQKKYSQKDAFTYTKDGVFQKILTLYLKVGDVLEYNIIEEEERNTSLIIAAKKIESSGGEPLCFVDTDGDGIPNHLDPDSDGDGCFDSYEAGVTGSTKSGASTDSIATGSYGSNGLANSLENNDTDSAKVSYDNKYRLYAVSKTLNVCTDTDNDGIGDLVDIDDDNDGVLDAEESPSCFYKKLELRGSMKITSQFTSPDDDQKDGDIQLLHDGATTTQTFNFDAFTTTQNPTGSNLFTIEYPTPVSPATIVISDKISATTNANAVVKGSNDGVRWSTALSPATVITGSPVTFNLTNTTPFKYYRIETGSIAGALATANTIGEITTTFRGYGASSHPKSVCTTDTDNDGKYNHFDLDSDGDRCFDSFESGVTGSTRSGASTDSIATGSYGSNGLANSLENNDTDSAKVNYDNKYTSYAVSKVLNVCADTDNDGIDDLVDIDDDNDGVRDADEGHTCLSYDNTSCDDVKDYRWIVWTSTTGTTAADGYIDLPSGERVTVQYTGDVQSLFSATDMNTTNEYCPYNGQQGNGASEMIQTFSGVGTVHKFVFSKPLVFPVFQVWSLGSGIVPVRYDFSEGCKDH